MSDDYYFKRMSRFGLPAMESMTRDQDGRLAQRILGGARALRVSRDDFQALRDLQLRRRWDWPATFSTNGREIWPFVCNGLTPVEEREDVSGLSTLLDEVARLRMTVGKPSGGRFFINEQGAFWKDEFSVIRQFVIFEFQK